MKKHTRLHAKTLLAFTCGSSLLSPLLVRAADATWVPTAAGTAYDWANNASWDPATFPNGAGDIANLTNNIAGNQTVRLLTNSITLGTLNIGDLDSTHSFTLSATSGGLIFQGATPGAGTFINATSTSANTISAPITVASNTPLTVGNVGTLTLSGGLTLSANSSLALNNAGTLNVSGPVALSSSSPLTITNAGILNLSGALSGGSSLTKNGAAQLNLTGANTHSGTFTIEGGKTFVGGANAHLASTDIIVRGNAVGGVIGGTAILELGNASTAATGATGGLINDSATVSLAGGVFSYQGTNFLGASSEAFQTLRLTEGSSRIDVGAGASRTSTLVLTNLSREAGATAQVRVTTSGTITVANEATLGLVGGNGDNTTNKSIVPWLVGGSSLSVEGTQFMTYDATNGLRALNHLTGDFTSNLGTAAADDNVRIGTALTLTVDKSINSLRLTHTGAATISADRTLTITSGALAFDGANTSIATGGTINFGEAEGIIYSFQTATNAIDSVISGSKGITKAGTGTLTLSGANTYTGTTHIAAGSLRAGAENVLNNTAVVLANTNTNPVNTVATPNVVTKLELNNYNQSVASLAGGGAFGGNVELGTATLTVGNSEEDTAATSYGGVISGSGSVVKIGSSRQILTGANTHSGGTSITGGDLRLANTAGSATGSGAFLVNAATVSGTGIATGATTVQNGGFVAAGDNASAFGTDRANFGSAGTLGLGTLGGLTLTSASFDFDLAAINTVGAGVNDLITTAALTFDNASVGFTFHGLDGALQTGVAYTLIEASSVSGFDTATISTTFLGSLAGQYTATYSVNGANDLVVTFGSAIPEPSSCALLLGAAGLLVATQRRRRARG